MIRRSLWKALNISVVLSMVLSSFTSFKYTVRATEENSEGSPVLSVVTQSQTARDRKASLPESEASIFLSPDAQIDSCSPTYGDLEVITSTTCSLSAGSYIFDSIIVRSGGQLVLIGDPVLEVGVTITATNVTIDSGGYISADGQGFGDEDGPGAGIYGSGGGYGGFGSKATFGGGGPAGEPYGDVYQPDVLGSGGGTHQWGTGGAGGGAIHLLVMDTLAISGTISANGTDGGSGWVYGGGGSGGSIWIESSTLIGSGSIRANGGAGYQAGNGTSGGGSGGRIAIDYTNSSFSGEVQASGGYGLPYAGAGTIYWKPEDQLNIDNNGYSGNSAGLVEGEYEFTGIDLSGYGSLVVLSSTLTLDNGTVSGDGTAILAVFGIANAPADFSIDGFTLDVRGDLAGADNVSIQEQSGMVLRANTPFHTGPIEFDSLVVSGTLQLAPYDNGNTVYTDDLPLELVVNTITVYNGGHISADGLGYIDEHGPGAGIYGAGAGYGGQGGLPKYNDGTTGQPYGDLYEPNALGSGGGSHQWGIGGAGGGAVHLVVTETLTLDGTISANGDDGGYKPGGYFLSGGGGSGGSIWIETATLTGQETGLIQANGGSAPVDSDGTSGGGSGGRITIDYGYSSFEGYLQAFGGYGNQYGGAGSVYWIPEDRLIINNDGHDGPPAGLLSGSYDISSIELEGYGLLMCWGLARPSR